MHHIDTASNFATRALEALDGLSLADLHGMNLQCDGASRALSHVLEHVGIDHEVHIGRLDVKDVGTIPLHWWVVLSNGAHCDIRARMWLGSDPAVPHGVFQPTSNHRYQSKQVTGPETSSLLFWILTSKDLASFVTAIKTGETVV